MQRRFFELLTEIAYGLVEKELAYENKKKDDNYFYFQQQELVSSIQKLGLFMLEYGIVNEEGFPLAPQNETEAVIYYFSKPLNEWPCADHPKFKECLVFSEDEEVLAHLYQNNTLFYTTEWCKELAYECRKYNQDAMQRDVYQKLMQVSEQQYEYLRKFIINYPILDIKGRSEFIKSGKNLELNVGYLEEFLHAAYEPLPENILGQCCYCGWTVVQNDIHKCCIDTRCKTETDDFLNVHDIVQGTTKMRLKSGVMKYICLPGKDELELVTYCKKLNFQTKLWPNKDRYDVQIQTTRGVLAIDVKGYYSPFSLAYHIQQKGVFNRINDNEEPILVIPNHRILKKGYIEIVKDALPVNKNIKCLNMKELKKFLREEVNNGYIK